LKKQERKSNQNGEGELKQVKAMLRSVLLSCKEGVASQRFLVDYRDVTGEYLPYKKFGFSSVSDFIASIPDVVHVRRQGGEEIYHAVADETTAHIQKLVSKQRSKKTKRPLRKAPVRNQFRFGNRPMGRGYTPPYQPQGGGYSRPPVHQPHYAAVRRFDPRPYVSSPQVHRAPLLPLPRSSPEEWSSSSPPSSPMNSNEAFHNFQITLHNSAGSRMVGAGYGGPRPRAGRMIMRAVSEAVMDCQGQPRPNSIKFGHKFEVPPRFRRNHDLLGLGEPFPGLPTPLPLPVQMMFYGDGTDYLEKLNKYIWKRNLLPIKFDTTQAKSGLYVSSVKVDGRVFASIDLFATAQEAEYVAAKNACNALEVDKDASPVAASSSMAVSDTALRDWIRETLDPLLNGLWGCWIPILFKEKFLEEAPAHLLSARLAHGRTLLKSVQVKFLDYGNTETGPSVLHPQLPDTTASIAAQSQDEPSPSLKEFSEVVKDSPLSALTVAYNTDGQCEVELHKDDMSINDYLIKKGLVKSERLCYYLMTSSWMCMCASSVRPGCHYQDSGEEYSDKLDVFEAQLEDCFKKADPDTFIAPVAVCIASMDGLYQRVLINSVTDGKAECYFTDHGDTENISLSQLRSLPLDLNTSLPYQAVRCYLNGLEKVTDTVTALESLLDMALGKTCVAEIVDRDERLSVILYDTNDDNDLDINKAVIKAILAKDPQNLNVTEGAAAAAASLPQPPSTHSNSVSQRVTAPVQDPFPTAVVNSEQSRNSNGTVKSEPTLPSSHGGLNKAFVRRKMPQPELVDIPGVGEFFDVHVLWVSDPTNFWCTPYKMVLCLENMMKDLNTHFNSHTKRVVLEEKDLTAGMLMAGCLEGAWYRIIKNIIEHQMSVYFPDYGQYNILGIEDLQPLPEQFYALPLCAVKAKLHDISQDDRSAHKGINFVRINKPWSEAAKYKFMEMAQGRDFVCLVCDKNKSSGMVSVKLVDTSSDQEDVLIDEVLIDMNFARSLDS
ncbi:LOW QUALITY PROTEIN: tudor domain-containing protein 7-like, partial [Haliotis rubra]|uniref:LOW QUALITY PROTEIN: tudor domain-containing protein 7-like n=1 Tax=Haliotis rubra TaxID=36100 RepID=UPI001EE5C5AC